MLVNLFVFLMYLSFVTAVPDRTEEWEGKLFFPINKLLKCNELRVVNT